MSTATKQTSLNIQDSQNTYVKKYKIDKILPKITITGYSGLMLNPEQQKAVDTLTGPVRIIAGPGTGKTHTLVARIENLIQNDTRPSKILALTFTNKAAHEIAERLSSKQVQVKTFHSLAAKLLRQFWQQDFTINDEEDENTLSFDDLISQFLEILDQTDRLTKCQSLFTHILVDEYQDVSKQQIEILKRLSAAHHNLCVVGDADQTIYSWRGAHASTMQNFTELYPNAETITLTTNYRNPPTVLKSAQALIENNPNRLSKDLTAPKPDTAHPIQLWLSPDYWHQNEVLAHLLQHYLGSCSNMHDADHLDTGHDKDTYSFGDIAIIYRTQNQGKQIKTQLSNRGYPCQLSNPENFWERSEIKDFLAHLSPLVHLPEFPDQNFTSWFTERITDYIDQTTPKPQQEKRLHSLIQLAYPYAHIHIREALQAFLDEAATQQEADNIFEKNAIQLLTFHAAKGLEFPIVIIPGLEDGITPHKKHLDDPYWLAEERRLFYVGLTRAQKHLHLLTNTKAAKQKSRFLTEIPQPPISNLPELKLQQIRKKKIKKSQMSLF